MSENEKRICRVGDKAYLSKTFTEADMKAFAELTLDDNGMHMDPEFAAMGLFHRPVVHGILAGSLLSSIMGTQLPGHGAVIMSQDSQYLNPVFPGDTVTAEVTLTGIEEKEKYYIATLDGVCTNQDGIPVVKAVTRELMLKRLFDIEK